MNYMGDSTWWNERFKSRALEVMDHEQCLEEDLRYFPSKGKILDVACGDGRNAIYLARLGYEILAIDFCEEALERLNYFANYENLTIRTMMVDLSKDNLKILNEKFDAIIINHYKLSSQRYADMDNCLNKDGVLWVNGFHAVPISNPDVKETDINMEQDYESLKNYILVDKKVYEDNKRLFSRYIWRNQ